jgi:hypothetical protein
MGLVKEFKESQHASVGIMQSVIELLIVLGDIVLDWAVD